MDLSTGAMFSSDFGDVGDFGGLGWSWVVLESRFLGFVDRSNVFEGQGERESPLKACGSLLELWSSLRAWRNEHGLLGRCVYIYMEVCSIPPTLFTLKGLWQISKGLGDHGAGAL